MSYITKPKPGIMINPLHPLSKGLAGCWLFNEGAGSLANDISGNNNHGRLTDMLPNTQDSGWGGSKFGGGLKFDGIDDNIRITDANSLDVTPAMSAFAWVKGNAQNAKMIISKYDSVADKRSWIIRSTDASPYQKMRITISDNGVYDAAHIKDYYSSIDILDNAWHFAGFTFNAGTLKLYIDGVEDPNPTKALDPAITTIFTSDRDVIVGAYLTNNIPINFFTGSINGAGIYNRALTATEIKQLYHDPYCNLLKS